MGESDKVNYPDLNIEDFFDWEWLKGQMSTGVIHLTFSVIGYFFLVGFGVLFNQDLTSTAIVAYFMMLAWGTGIEAGQNGMKIEYAKKQGKRLSLRDVVDSLIDFVSWIFIPSFLTAGFVLS